MEIEKLKQYLENKGVNAQQINCFINQYKRYCNSENSYIRESDIKPLEKLDSLGDSSFKTDFSNVAAIKLNGGLGTSMGLSGPKSSLVIKDGLSFFDIACLQIKNIEEKTGERVPLIFMNSFSTNSWVQSKLKEIEHNLVYQRGIQRTFLQNKSPKIDIETKEPVKWEKDKSLEWCPPGHGDIYNCLVHNELLDNLINEGIEYLFISNIDNLQATVSGQILNYLKSNNIDFLMEVCRRHPSDKKGGHLARTQDGRIILRERAQCVEQELSYFEDINIHKYFNTNSIWIKISTLKRKLLENGGYLPLDLILNYKTVDPKDPSSTKVVQLETAMGSAIRFFENSSCLEVPRSRFLPVKNTNDLLLLRSDVFGLGDDYSLVHHDSSWELPVIELDCAFYNNISDFESLFTVVPSLKACQSFKVVGKRAFDRDEEYEGECRVEMND